MARWRIRRRSAGEAVIRLHREHTKGKKKEENRARACVYEKKVLPLHPQFVRSDEPLGC